MTDKPLDRPSGFAQEATGQEGDAAAHALLRVLVCGGRDYQNAARVGHVLSTLHRKRGIAEIIHGAAKGADTLAGMWARASGIKETAVPAEWNKHGKSAGPIRNREMLALKPDGVVAFPGGRGTKDMALAAEAAGVKVLRVDW